MILIKRSQRLSIEDLPIWLFLCITGSATGIKFLFADARHVKNVATYAALFALYLPVAINFDNSRDTNDLIYLQFAG
ncbi:hypothetical protein KCU81_g541, partial [Aureobasidium melanogenum]